MRYSPKTEEVEIDVSILMQTAQAIRVRTILTEKEAWVPKSQILDYGEDAKGVTNSIFLPEWLALEKGLI